MNHIPTFGEILRERRTQLGLTQTELARRASCAPITIRKLEGDALRPSVQLAELLALALDIPEAEQVSFVRLARQEPPPSPIPHPTPAPSEIGLDDLTGRAVKGFLLAEMIGSGGFGVVYRGVQRSVQRDVAVKIIPPRFANHPTFVRRFEAEAQLVARLEHPHIVPLYDYWREPNAAYLIMRLLRGGGLNTALTQGALPLPMVRRVARQVGQALAVAHARGVLHQDIKPANILLDELQNAYLADFGIAKNLTFAEGANLTEQGTLISSPAYISPEQIRDEPVRPSSDVYCFGLLLYEMLTGHAAFQGPTPVSLLQQHLHQPVPLLQDSVPDLPAGLDEILQRATAKRPQDRFQEMEPLLVALEAVLNPAVQLTSQETAVVPSLTPQEIANLENPYRGLHAFTEADAANFFGRETLVQELLGRMSDGSDLERFIAVVGPSGSGKSSLVKAGLLPSLRRGGLPGSENWFIVDLTPGSHPFEEVAAALRRVAGNPTDSLLGELTKDERGLLRAVNHCLPDDGETELLLLIDQFEELFTLVEVEVVREAFLQSLVTAVLDPESRVRLLITLRADFLDRPLQYVDFGELMQQRLSLVLPLTPDELTQAIAHPVEKLGLTMAPELIATMMQDVGTQPGMLPLLQYALTELFDQREGLAIMLATYRKTGGVTGALAHRADEIFHLLEPAEQEVARQLFLRLVTLGEGVEDTRRRVLLAELEMLKTSEVSKTSEVLDEFGKYRLLTFDHDPVTRGPTVEVAHEALLREWPRLRSWLQESREDVRRQRVLAHAATRWHVNQQDDSYLLRGSRLTSFEAWAETTSVALTPREREYLQKSVAERDKRHAAEEARRQRELETVRRLAEEQSKRAEEQAQAAVSLRKRAFILAGALVVAAILAVVALYLGQIANENANLARSNERQAVEAFSLSLAANARQALAAEDTELALLLALAANTIENPPAAAWQTLIDVAYAPAARSEISFADTFPLAVAPLPDGRSLLVGLENGEMQLRDVDSGALLRTFAGHRAGVQAIAVSPDGTMALSGGGDGTAVLWNLETGEVLQQFTGHGHPVSAVAFLPDGTRVMTGVDSARVPGDLRVWEVASGEIISQFGATLTENSEGITSLALLQNGQQVLVGLGSVSGTNPAPLVLWEVASETIVQSARMPDDLAVNAIAVSPDEQFALLASADNNVYLFDLTTFEIVREMKGHSSAVQSVAFSPDGKTAVSSGQDDLILWWEVATGRLIYRFVGHSDDIRQVGFLSDGQIASVSDDGSLHLWDLHSHWEIERFPLGHDEAFIFPTVCDGRCNANIALAMNPDGRSLLVSPGDQSLIRLDYETGVVHTLWADSGMRINDIAISGDGRKALLALNEGTISYWDLVDEQEIQRLDGFNGLAGAALSANLSEDGQYGLVTMFNGEIVYWNLAEGRVIRRMSGHILEGVTVRFLPGEQTAVSGSVDGTMIVWDLQTGAQIKRLTGLTGGAGSHLRPNQIEGIWALAIAPDGQHILSSGWDQTLLLWDLQTGESIRRFSSMTGYEYDVAFLPGGQTALSTTQNRTLILWDVATAEPIQEFVVYDRPLAQAGNLPPPLLALHPDGKTAVTLEENGPLIKWRLTPPAPTELLDWIAHNRLLRELTCLERETYQITPLCADGVPPETTADLLAQVAAAATTFEMPGEETAVAETAAPLTLSATAPATTAAQLGENRGELGRNEYDVWTIEMKAGERYVMQMIADRPMHDFLPQTPLADRFATGALNTALYVIGPDGGQLTRATGTSGENGAVLTDTRIDLFIAPVDGLYQIEARSHLDNEAGGYTLIVEQVEPITVAPEILAEYEGHYIEGPWQFDVYVTVEDGQLQLFLEQAGLAFDQIPLSETEFISQGDGSISVFTRDAAGRVDGYNLWVALLHPAGGQWYRAEKVDE